MNTQDLTKDLTPLAIQSVWQTIPKHIRIDAVLKYFKSIDGTVLPEPKPSYLMELAYDELQINLVPRIEAELK